MRLNIFGEYPVRRVSQAMTGYHGLIAVAVDGFLGTNFSTLHTACSGLRGWLAPKELLLYRTLTLSHDPPNSM